VCCNKKPSSACSRSIVASSVESWPWEDRSNSESMTYGCCHPNGPNHSERCEGHRKPCSMDYGGLKFSIEELVRQSIPTASQCPAREVSDQREKEREVECCQSTVTAGPRSSDDTSAPSIRAWIDGSAQSWYNITRHHTSAAPCPRQSFVH
jgi:hypothetical protein